MAYKQRGLQFIVKLIDHTFQHRPGNDYTLLMRDIKSKAGVIERLNKVKLPNGTAFVEIWAVPQEDYGDHRAYRLMGVYPATYFDTHSRIAS